jgi:hypothetical protein
MRTRLPLTLVFVLTCLSGCSAEPAGAKIKAVLTDQSLLINLLKKIKNKDAVLQFTDEENALKDHVGDDVQALGELGQNLSDEEKLRLQLKYGPAIESMYIALNKEVKRVVMMGVGGGGPPAGAQDVIQIDAQAAWLVDGYSSMSNIVQRDLNELGGIFKGIQTAAQAQDAVPNLRKLRHRLSVNVAKLQHVVPARKNVRDELQAALKAAVQTSIGALRQEEERVRAISGGQDAVSAVEPLPDQLTSLIAS